MKKIFKRLIILALVMVIALGIFVFVINYKVVKYARRYMLSENAVDKYNYDAAVVLGASVKKDKTPSLMLQDRLDKAVVLYTSGVVKRVIMTGDHIDDYYNEVNPMKDYAVGKGIDSNNIFLDHYGISTYDSMYRMKEVFSTEKPLIITQDYHLYRAIYIARKLGMDAYGISSNEREYTMQFYYDFRELLARVKDYFKVMKKPTSKYKSSKISLATDGDLTNEKE